MKESKMTVTQIAEKICEIIKSYSERDSFVSIIHRYKNKENAGDLIFKAIDRKYWLNEIEKIKIDFF